MATATVEFRKTEYLLGEKVYADFTWLSAKYNFKADTYGTLALHLPNGSVITKRELITSEGSGTLRFDAITPGRWEARASLWNGSSWDRLSHYTDVVKEEAAPPPAPPPEPEPEPPPGLTYSIRVNPRMAGVTVRLYNSIGNNIRTQVTGSNGLTIFTNLPIGIYSYRINHPGYEPVQRNIVLGANQSWNFDLVPIEEPPPPTPEPEECPSFWTNPIGAIMCWILNSITALTTWINDSIMTKLGTMWDVVSNFSQDVLDFLGDATGTVIKWVQDNTAAIFSWISDNFLNFIDWLSDLVGGVAGYIGDAVSGAIDFITDKFTVFVSWLNDLAGSIADYIGDAIGDFVDWSSDQLGSIWEGLQDWFGEAIAGLVEAFFGGLDAGVEEAKGSPLHSDEPVRNPVLKGLQKVVRKHRKKYNRDEITGEKKNGTI